MANQLTWKSTCILSIDQIRKIKCEKLVISLNNIYFESQLNYLTNTLKKLKQMALEHNFNCLL